MEKGVKTPGKYGNLLEINKSTFRSAEVGLAETEKTPYPKEGCP
jgi:hypothetical protein